MISNSTLIQPRQRTRSIYIACAVLATVAAIWIGAIAWRMNAEVSRLAPIIERLQRRVNRPPPEPSKSDQEMAKEWEAFQRQRAFPWHELTRALEHAIDPDVELDAFVPDPAQRTVAINGRAKSRDAVLRYVKLLEAQSALTDVYLVHEGQEQQDGIDLFAFEVRGTIR